MEKYKVKDLVADLNVDKPEVYEVIKDFRGKQIKSPQTAVDTEDSDAVIAYFSSSESTKNFDDYLASIPTKVDPPVEPKEPPKSVKTENVTPNKNDSVAQPKRAEIKPQAVAKPAPEKRQNRPVGNNAQNGSQTRNQNQNQRQPMQQRNNNYTGNNSNSNNDTRNSRGMGYSQNQPNQGFRKNTPAPQRNVNSSTNVGVQNTPSVKTENANVAKFKAKQAQAELQKQQQSTMKPSDRFAATKSAELKAIADAKAKAEKERREKSAEARRLSRPAIPARQITAQIDISNVKANVPASQGAKPKNTEVVIQPQAEQIVKRVDTRGVFSDASKYDDRYEKIASSTVRAKKDEFSTTKQKINQKSAQKPIGKGKPGANRSQPRFIKQKETEAQKLKRLELEQARKIQLKVLIPDEISISDLAERLKQTAAKAIQKLWTLGIKPASASEIIDFDTAALITEEFKAKPIHEKVVTIEERLFEEVPDTDKNLQPRPPVVVVMGHVDHGKTSLLDRIRGANVAEGEAGGITQHIGAHSIESDGNRITFLDTPGHEAFTAMRVRGALATDIAILVVAADDGIKPQTIEAINHAKAAGVTIIVAINKIDKEDANPQKIREQLTEYGLIAEEWGGDTVIAEVSAKKDIGIDNLLEMVSLTAEVLELKANPERLAAGTVIEARLDKGKGPIASLLVQKGTLKTGDHIIAGSSVGRVRKMRDDKGKVVKFAGPSVPVEITGLAEVPRAGDSFSAVEDEKLAKELAEKRKHEEKVKIENRYKKINAGNLAEHIKSGDIKSLPIIIKADVQGSAEAIRTSLEKIEVDGVRVKVIHALAGGITESDVMLASAAGAIIIGFNVRPLPAAEAAAKHDAVDLRLCSVIYQAIDEIEKAMKGMLDPLFKEISLGKVEVRQKFKITNVGEVAGCYITDGKVERGASLRVIRDSIVIAEDKIAGLKRFKDDVKEVGTGFECGITLKSYSDYRVGDILEVFRLEQIQN